MTNCWKVNPKDRPTFPEILQDIREMLADHEVHCTKVIYRWRVYIHVYCLNELKLLDF
jgi:hypothetical protein